MDCCRDSAALRPLLKKSTLKRYDESHAGEEFDQVRDPSPSGMGLLLRRIWLLQWKNLLVRRRHYIITTLEVFLPTLFAILLAYMRTETIGDTSTFTHVTTYKEVTENEMKELLVYDIKSKCRNCLIAFAPENDLTKKVMDHVKANLEETIKKIGGPNPEFVVDWRLFKSEADIIAYSAQLQLNNTGHETLRVAIIFGSGFGQVKTNQIAYKIRIVDDVDTFPTDSLFPGLQLPGPSEENNIRYGGAGFSGLQVLVDKALTLVLTQKEMTHTISQQAFPYPPYEHSLDFRNFYFILMPQFLVLGFLFIVPSIIRTIVSEKETGIKELMKLMGLPTWMHWLGYMLNSLLVLVISITIVILLFFIPFNANTGAVLVHGNPTLWWFVLFLYVISSTAFCFFISSLFQRPTLAIIFGIVVWLVSYYAVATPLEGRYATLSLCFKLFVALLPNMSLQWAIRVLCAFETRAIGAQWSNIAEPISSVDSMSLGLICLMFVLNTIMYMALTLYFEAVIPSEFGIRRPWYFIFKPLWLFNAKGKGATRPSTVYANGDDDRSFERDPPGVPVGVEIINLRKVFGKGKVAVDGINLKIFEGQITALLGHNGAGKTTTMSMLTGLFSPSSGTATVNGYDIVTQMDKVRSNLGLCPQHNLLFGELTAGEHLRFFARLKGLSSAQATSEMKDILHKLQLTEKMDIYARALSGGQKRKLSLGIALIGNSQVVFLDEPTSGMDPEARRAIWDLLLGLRGSRTIILSTHFMEEADVLGERIAIMANGRLQCSGSPSFLKNYYGAGYTLKLTGSSALEHEKILNLVGKWIPKAYLKEESTPNEREMGITLPLEDAPTQKFPGLFSELQDKRNGLGIDTIGLGLTTMDEVFVKVGELVDGVPPEVKDGGNNNEGWNHSRLVEERLKGLRLARAQFEGMLRKRIMYTYRKRKLVLSQMVMPILLLIIAIYISNQAFEGSDPPSELPIKISAYRRPITLFSSTSDALASIYTGLLSGSSEIKRISGNLSSELAGIGVSDLAAYRERYILASESNQTNFKAMFSTIPYHSCPLSINLASNTLLKSIDPNLSISVSNHPLRSALEILIEAAKTNPVFSTTIPILFAVFLPIGLALMAASFVVFPVEERLCSSKQLQMMTNVSPLIYWGSSILWDFTLMLGLICVMVLCFPIVQNYGAFTSYGGGWVIFLILAVFGWSGISFSYLVSSLSFVGSVAGGFALLTIIHIGTGMVMCLVVFSLELGGITTLADEIRWVSRLFPTFGAAMSVMRFTEIATKNSRCNILSAQAKQIICDPNVIVPPEIRSCCENCHDFGICFEPQPYITWSIKKKGLFEESSTPGIGQELLIMFIMAFVYQILLLLVEYRVFDRLIQRVFKSSTKLFRGDVDEVDVAAESGRVKDMVDGGASSTDALVVDGLCKSFGSFAAVSNVSFGVHHGECFGLLGINGAGKTTTFRMITGDEWPSNGNSLASGLSLIRNRKEFLAGIGYCPQFDGIIGVLTGREMLELFGRLRGIPDGHIQEEAGKWLEKMGLSESGDVQCGKYSGGMKRRLSTAMALIGDPPIVLLDEPTSGVDPVARRKFWQVISSVRENGQAVILTSHSMEECEALCSRLAIMVNGQIQCFGGVQHLKSKYAQGYTLTIRLKSSVPEDSEELRDLKDEISRHFEPCVLKDYHQNILHYQLQNTKMPWSELFSRMETTRGSWESIIEEYSVNESTLEEVYLSFARKQYGGRVADISLLKKCLTCQLF